MADDTTNTAPATPATPPTEKSPFTVETHTENVKAQVVSQRGPDPDTVAVHETRVRVDEVITDPSSPQAVQIPDAGRGDASTPIANAFGDAELVEDVFAREADKPAPAE